MIWSRPRTLAAAAARWARKAAVVSAGAALVIGAIPALAAHADGKVTWKNTATDNYLEAYRSGTSNGTYVGQWPWNGSDTQYWYDVKLSSGYWLEYNYNSWLLLTAYNSCGDGVTQWDDGGWSTQEWKEKHLNTAYGWVLINHAGCSGDAWHDILSLSAGNTNIYNVYLYSEKSGPCSLALWPDEMGPQTQCTWK
jgi:hypothetical protein